MIWGLIKNNLKLMLRSKWILLLMLALPLLVISLLSSVFEDLMDTDVTISPFTVAYRLAPESRYTGSLTLISELCTENDITLADYSDYFTATPEKEAVEALMAGEEAAVFIDIRDEHLTFYRNMDFEVEAMVAENIFSTVIQKADEAETILSHSVSAAASPFTASSSDSSPSVSSSSAASPSDSSSSAAQSENRLRRVKLDTDPVPNAKDYYGIIETVYFLWCGCVSLSAVVPSERKNRITTRFRMTTASRLGLYAGKFIPCLLAILFEAAGIILLSSAFMDVHWGNWPGSALVLLLLTLAATAFGMMLFTVFSHIAVSIAAGWILIFTSGFLGGSFETYIYSFLPDRIMRLSPQYYINRTLVEFSTQGHSDYFLPCCAVLVLILIGCTVISFIAAERRELC